MNFTDGISAKNVGKMGDSEYFDSLYLLEFKSNVYLFLQGLSYSVLSVHGKKLDS